MDRQGSKHIAGLNALGREHGLPLLAQGIGSIFCTVFSELAALSNYRDYKSSDEALRVRFVEELQHRGVRTTVRGTWFMSTVLSDEDIDATLEAANGALEVLAKEVRA